MKKVIASVLTGVIAAGLISTTAFANETITVAASAAPHAEILEQAAPILAEQGYDLEALLKKAEEEGLTDLLMNIEFPLTVTLDAMERNGMNVSEESLKSLHAEFTVRLSELEKEIYELTGIEFNIGSPKQLSEVLFDADKLNLPHGKKGKTGVYST